jgi:hypothetical protein
MNIKNQPKAVITDPLLPAAVKASLEAAGIQVISDL